MDTKYSAIVTLATHAAAVFAPAAGADFLLGWLVDGKITEADEYAAKLKDFQFRGIVALIDGQVVCKVEPERLALGLRAAEHFTQRLESLPPEEFARLELERLAKLEDTRP